VNFIDSQFGKFLDDPARSVPFGDDESDGYRYRWRWDCNDFTGGFDAGAENSWTPLVDSITDGEWVS
jgi:hypothetical protein